MRRPTCEVCRGAKTIRLPLYRLKRLSELVHYDPMSAEPSSRQYPCPECSETVPQERLAIMECCVTIDSHYAINPEIMRYAKEDASGSLVSALLDGDFIQFRRGPDDPARRTSSIVATVGVVSKTHVATLEQRIATDREGLTREIIEDASRQIYNWNSHYVGPSGNIPKSQAIMELREAVARILKTDSHYPKRETPR